MNDSRYPPKLHHRNNIDSVLNPGAPFFKIKINKRQIITLIIKGYSNYYHQTGRKYKTTHYYVIMAELSKIKTK